MNFLRILCTMNIFLFYYKLNTILVIDKVFLLYMVDLEEEFKFTVALIMIKVSKNYWIWLTIILVFSTAFLLKRGKYLEFSQNLVYNQYFLSHLKLNTILGIDKILLFIWQIWKKNFNLNLALIMIRILKSYCKIKYFSFQYSMILWQIHLSWILRRIL